MLQLFHYFIFGEIGKYFIDFYRVEEIVGGLAETGLTIDAFTQFGNSCVVADLLVSHFIQEYQSK